MMEEYNISDYEKKKNNTFTSIVLGVYVVLIGLGLPLVVKDKYFDILVTKYYYYCFCTVVMVILLVFNFLIISWKQMKNRKRVYLKSVLKHLTWADYSALLFLFVAGLSTFTSDYVYEAFWGNEGRFTGLFLIMWYIVSYFCIGKIWRFKIWYIDLILITGVVVSLFGITDYFKLDIFSFKELIIVEQKKSFTSTIGNINTYTAYVGIIVAITAVLFSKVKSLQRVFFYYICLVISFLAIIMGNSDNAFLSLGALFAFLPFYLFRNSEGIKRYIIIVATFLSVIQCINWINGYFGDGVLGINSFFNMIVRLRGFDLVTKGLWLIVGIWYFTDYRKGKNQVEYGNTPRFFWLVLLICSALFVLYIFYDCNIVGNTEKYNSVASYVLFNDRWGTNRGYIWRNAIDCYFDFSPWKKLVGYGPETFGIFMLQKTANNPYNEIFDSAHNEYLHLLTTVGIAGLLSYLTFIIAVIKQGIQFGKNNPYIIAVIFGIICYCIQAFVNLNLPIVTPVLWLLLGIASTSTVSS